MAGRDWPSSGPGRGLPRPSRRVRARAAHADPARRVEAWARHRGCPRSPSARLEPGPPPMRKEKAAPRQGRSPLSRGSVWLPDPTSCCPPRPHRDSGVRAPIVIAPFRRQFAAVLPDSSGRGPLRVPRRPWAHGQRSPQSLESRGDTSTPRPTSTGRAPQQKQSPRRNGVQCVCPSGATRAMYPAGAPRARWRTQRGMPTARRRPHDRGKAARVARRPRCAGARGLVVKRFQTGGTRRQARLGRT